MSLTCKEKTIWNLYKIYSLYKKNRILYILCKTFDIRWKWFYKFDSWTILKQYFYKIWVSAQIFRNAFPFFCYFSYGFHVHFFTGKLKHLVSFGFALCVENWFTERDRYHCTFPELDMFQTGYFPTKCLIMPPLSSPTSSKHNQLIHDLSSFY